MDKNARCCISIYNDSGDPTYENWLAFYACIINKNLSVSTALKIMGIANEADVPESKGGTGYES